MKEKEIERLLTEFSRLARMSDKAVKGDIMYSELDKFAEVIGNSKELIKKTRYKLRNKVV